MKPTLDDDIAPEYDFPELHRRAKELGREYKGMLSESGREMLRVLRETEEVHERMTGGGTTEQSLETLEAMLEETTAADDDCDIMPTKPSPSNNRRRCK